MVTDSKDKIRAIFWGMTGSFSYFVLEGLLAAGVSIYGVVTPAAMNGKDDDAIVRVDPNPIQSQLPMSQPFVDRNVVNLAWQHQIPVFEIRRINAPSVSTQLESLKADVAVVACFPWRIPEQLLNVPAYGFLNLHPSLLPDYRGPYPLFWTFRLGQRRTGVTVHYMDAGMDTGAIALQANLHLPDGISGVQADHLMAVKGSAQLAKAVDLLQMGKLPRIPQRKGGSSFSQPTAGDFEILTSWSAQRAYNFMCGTAEWGHAYRIKGTGIDISVRQALSFDAGANQQATLLRDGSSFHIQFTPGVLHVR